MKFRSKPVEIEAVRWNGAQWSLQEVAKRAHELAPDRTLPLVYASNSGGVLVCRSLQGLVNADPGDWIILSEREAYPCKPDVFEARYELAECVRCSPRAKCPLHEASAEVLRFEVEKYRLGDKNVTLYGHGSDFRAYVDVDDVDSGQVLAVAAAAVEALNAAALPVPPETPYDEEGEL